MKENIIEEVKKLQATYAMHYQNVRAFHWMVKGPHFFELHAQFELFYNEANLMIDELAERVLTLEGKPFLNFKEFELNSTIKDLSSVSAYLEMVEAVKNSKCTLIEEMRKVLNLANDANDDATVDLVTPQITLLEKQTWMLRSFLGQ
jgi:starvation-inducible DNA-binding protein